MNGQKVGVIGAGIGGLTAAVYLAKAGYQVTLLEKAAYAGGSAGSYVRGGRTYPTGATIAYGLEPGGVLRELLTEIGVSVPAKALSHAMDVILSDRSVSVYEERGKWERELGRAFPEQAAAVLRFWRELAAIAEQVLAVTKTRAAFPLNRRHQLGRLPGLVLRRPLKLLRLVPHSLRTVEDLLRKHGLDRYAPLRSFLDAQLIDAAQTDCVHAALLPSALALDIYRCGSFAVDGGFGQLIARLADRLEQLGGQLLLRAPITELRREQDQWLVRSSSRLFSFDWVVNASGLAWNGSGLVEPASGKSLDGTGVTSGADATGKSLDGTGVTSRADATGTVNVLGPDDEESPERSGVKGVRDLIGFTGGRERLGDTEKVSTPDGWGAFRLDARVSADLLQALPAVTREPLRKAGLPFAWQIMPVLNGELLPASSGPVYITAHSSSDAEGRPVDGELLFTVSVHVRAEDWTGLGKESYRTAKSAMKEAILDEITRVLPAFRSHLLGLEAGSPRTYRTFVGKSRVGGFPLTVRNAILKPPGNLGNHPKLIVAGEQAFPGPGTLSAALSGYYAARAIAGKTV